MSTQHDNGYSGVDFFKEDMDDNISFLEHNWKGLSDEGDRQFCRQLLNYYDTHERLTDKQISYMVKYLRELME